MSEEYRRAKRKVVNDRIEVSDAMLQSVIGMIGNISETGIMMLTNQPMQDDALFQLQFSLQDTGGNVRQISLGAHQLWSEPANAPGQHWTGFRFIDIGPDDLTILRIWINLPGSQYV